MTERPLVLVTAGTDHHPFHRLSDWVERWLADRGDTVRCVVQHGTSRPVRGAECHEMLPHGELRGLMEEAAVVVCQGGPGGITEARSAGRLPVVVPRTARLGEHVDDHQLRFTQVMAGHGRIALAASAEELAAHLDAALAEPGRYGVVPDDGRVPATTLLFGKLIGELVARPRGRARRG
ncbi:glycosyl transferase family 28 [Planomonospora sp. ID67723]|uniref:glycosyltransferase n=1 Tax=Planomonospora sp. ID67723 TaxID=2738134 RepID=UPI0018C39941|nr:glycosyltransferase [Planomonospora sp. ID67723]MBG0827416.1 glycosyl transferase family 28 [Planomonospora sp. ID67723]